MVDDDDVLRGALARLLSSAGARVRDAAGGDPAIAIATAEHVDLLLTDMEMPGRDGAAVARAIATIHPEVVVVFMSGKSRELHVANGRLSSDDRLIEKPFGSAFLVETLATAIARCEV